jgi:CheY-like chemotaxis protein
VLLAAIAASLETARGQAEPGTPIRERLDRAAETLTQGSERVRQLVALTRSGSGPQGAVTIGAPGGEAAPGANPGSPSAAVEASAQAAGMQGAAVRPAGGRVVILDDEEPLVRVGKHLLKRLGHEATGFIHPREAIEAIERDPRGFDVLITDLTMPELSGHEVARAVAQIRPDLPIILLSGKLHDDGDALGIPNPVYQLGKPYTRDQLQQVVETALRGG